MGREVQGEMGKIKMTKTVCHHSRDTMKARGATISNWQTQDCFWPEMRRGQRNSETKQLSLQAWNGDGQLVATKNTHLDAVHKQKTVFG